MYIIKQLAICVAYTHLVRPTLEYASCVWDPYLVKDVSSLGMVQRRAARCICVALNYDWQSRISVSRSSTVNNLEWDMLTLRRQILRLKLLYKAVHLSSGLKIPIKKLLYNQLDLIIHYISSIN